MIRCPKLALLFILLALPLGLFLAGVVPLGQIADEQAHIARAEGLLHGEVLGQRRLVRQPDGRDALQAGVMADLAIINVVTSPIHPTDTTPETLDGAAVRVARAAPWRGRTEFVPLNTIATYLPIFYVPAALGILSAKAAGLTPYYAYLAARLANLTGFLLVGVAALMIARAARAVLFATLLLPTTLNLAASVNQDGLMIAVCALAVALLTTIRPAARETAAATAAAFLIGLIVIVKPPYLPLVGLLLLPLPARWRDAGRTLPTRITLIGLIVLATIAWTWINVQYVAAPIPRPPYEAGPLYTGARPAVFTGTDLAAQVKILLADPIRMLTLPLDTLRYDHALPHEVLAALGYLNMMLPDLLYVAWIIAMLAAFLADAFRPAPATLGLLFAEMLLLALVIAVSLQAILLSQYLTWTPVGMPWIGGLQGRYLLPLLPVAGLIAARIGLPGGWLIGGPLIALPVIAATADLFLLPRTVVAFYYMG